MDWADRIGRRVRLRDLHVVLAVAESGSMAKAAAHLSISHPVISKTISNLERTLGVGPQRVLVVVEVRVPQWVLRVEFGERFALKEFGFCLRRLGRLPNGGRRRRRRPGRSGWLGW